MPHTFSVFIDEAGDEGYNIVRPPAKKSSEWFLISAAICKCENLGKLNSKIPDFHFRKETHHSKISISETIASLPITAILVAAHKPSINESAALRSQKHYLFNYCSKLLLERVSWFCNSNGGGTAEVILSRRRNLSLTLFRDYLNLLKNSQSITLAGIPIFKPSTSINWSVIDPANVEMKEADSLAGLRVADAIVSGAYRAMEWSQHYNTEHRYMKILRSKFYRYGLLKKCQRYGIKFIPDDAPDRCFDVFEAHRFHWLRHFT